MRATSRSDTLKVPGATLHYEARGSGPVLLVMPGGPASVSVFQCITGHLAPQYTVVTYDRRGIAQSKLEDAIEDERLASRLREVLSRGVPDGPGLGGRERLDFVHSHQTGTVVYQ